MFMYGCHVVGVVNTKTVNLEKIIIIIQTRLDYNNGRGGARV